MTRPTRYKIGYVGVVLVLGVAIAVGVRMSGVGVPALAAIVILLLVPGRVLGLYYRDLFRGRRLLELRQPEASIPYTSRFLDDVRRHPGRKRLLWLAWSIYTPDAEAMALNNLGAAHLQSGNHDAAVAALRAALAVDPKFPLPYANLAIERHLAGDAAEAERLLAEAARLGHRRTRADLLVHQAGALLARVEGRGATNPAGS